MVEHVSSCKREHPQGKYLIKGNPVVIHMYIYIYMCWWLFCLYMCFFDCKCKSLTRLRENIQQKTGHPPAHHSAANKYLSGSGWMRCIFVLLLFSKVLCFSVFTRVCSLIHATTQKGKAKTNKTQEKQTNKQQTFEKNKTTKIQDVLQPTTRPRINIFQVPAGWAVFFFIEGFLHCFVVLMFLCFCLLFLSCCMYKRNNSSKNNTKQKQHREKQTKQKYSSSSRNLKDIYSRPSGGLDVLYFCCCCFSPMFFVVCLLFFCFVWCFA